MILKQGDTYSLPIKVKLNNEILSDVNVEKVEFCFDNIITKTYPDNVSFDTDHFVLRLSQEETFSLQGSIRYQVRVMFADGSVKSSPIRYGYIIDSLSKEVLT